LLIAKLSNIKTQEAKCSQKHGSHKQQHRAKSTKSTYAQLAAHSTMPKHSVQAANCPGTNSTHTSAQLQKDLFLV
ncbi:12471_t:CDS:2, partial [Acaulospora morrowiae]